MTHTKDYEVNSDNTKVVTKKFSASIRTNTILFLTISLLIPFVSFVMCIIYYIPDLYDKYEDKIASFQVKAFLEDVQEGILDIRVNKPINLQISFHSPSHFIYLIDWPFSVHVYESHKPRNCPNEGW